MQIQEPNHGYRPLSLNKYSKVVLTIMPEDWKAVSVKQITIDHKQGFYTNESYTDKGIKLVRITDLLNPSLSYQTMPLLGLDEKTIENFKVTDEKS